MSTFPEPEVTAINRPFYDGLAAGRLMFQKCPHCAHAWLPPREACPNCLEIGPDWVEAKGTGKVVTWVVYRQAYAEHLKAELPYNVTIVELDEGVRLLSNIIGHPDGAGLEPGMKVRLKIQEAHGYNLARFEPLSA